MRIKRTLLFLVLMNLVSCTQFQISPSPSPPIIIHVGITPSLVPSIQENLVFCASNTPGMGVILDLIPKKDLSLEDSDMIIQIGDPAMDINGFAYQIGWEEIVVIASADLHLVLNDKESIKEIYSSYQPELNILTYPSNHEIRNLFDQIFEIEETTPYGLVVPNPTAMLDSIDQNQNAIGYVPASWITQEIHTVALDSMESKDLLFPILVLLEKKPHEPTITFIGCLQQEL